MPYISVVTPVYNAVDIVDELYRQLVENLEKITKDFEIIMVNDADPTGSSAKIEALAQKDKRVKLIDFSRNFGQHIAISAGLDYAEGDYVVVMDCDLQDPPNKIPFLLEELKKSGKEVVFAIREDRKDSFFKILYSNIFRKIKNFLSDKIYFSIQGMGNFSILTKKVAQNIRKLRELNRDYGGFVQWCGYPILYVPIEYNARYSGKSGYTFFKSLKFAINIILHHSVKPLYLSGILSLIFFIISFFIALYILYNHWVGEYSVAGYASIMFAITFISALIFFSLSIMSMYLANIFKETQRRPLYIIGRSLNIEEKNND